MRFENKKITDKNTTIRPKNVKVGIQEILEWRPPENESGKIHRSSVPLASRMMGHQINPLANKKAKVQSLAQLSSSSKDYSAVGGSETMDIYSFAYWQYLDSLVFWDGLIPTPDVVDSGHRNGVPVLGTIFFNWSTAEEDRVSVDYFLQKDSEQTYPVARQLVEIAKYYGFDGYFINQETAMPANQGYGEEFRAFLYYLKEVAKEKNYPLEVAWYDSMDNDGSRAHYDEVNEKNNIYMRPTPKNNEVLADDFFINFNWTENHINRTVSEMQQLKRSPYDAYAGLELQAEGYYHTNQKRHALVDKNGQIKTSLGLFIPDAVMGIATDGEDYHVQADKFWTGFSGNPKIEADENEWSGISRFVVDKTPILGERFHTNFNTGHGRYWFKEGKKVRKTSWNSRGIQDVLPTWRWWIKNKNADISARYDFDEAFNGGVSLQFSGNLAGESSSNLMLYATKMSITPETKMRISAKGKESVKTQIGLSTDPKYKEESFVYYDFSPDETWETQEISLKEIAGKTVYAVKLRLQASEGVPAYQLNVGEFAIYKEEKQINSPATVQILKQVLFNAQQAEAIIKVEPVAHVKNYEVYQFKNNQWEFVNASSSNYIYLANITREKQAKGKNQKLKVIAVGETGRRAKAKEFIFPWGMEVCDTTLPAKESENIMTKAKVISEIAEDNTESPKNVLTGTINNSADKWYSSHEQEHVDIELPKAEKVLRWVVEHAGAGGESADNGLMNTKDFNLEYEDLQTGQWEIAQEIRGNLAHVTDLVFKEPITAKRWRLNILTADNGTPWGGIRVYNWKMYTTLNEESQNLPMATTYALNTTDKNYSVVLANGKKDTQVSLFTDRQAQNELAQGFVNQEGNMVFHNLTLEGSAGLLYYKTKESKRAFSNLLVIPYQQQSNHIEKVELDRTQPIYVDQTQPLDLALIKLEVTLSDQSSFFISLDHELVDVQPYDRNKNGIQKLAVTYAGIESSTSLLVDYQEVDFDEKEVSSIEISKLPKQRYLVGERLDLAKGTMQIIYQDGFQREVSLENLELFEVSELDSSQLGKQKIEINHQGHTVDFEVVVEAESVNLQRLDQLIGQFEALEYHENYLQLADEDKQVIATFIAFGRSKSESKEITQVEVDEIVAQNTGIFQQIQKKLTQEV